MLQLFAKDNNVVIMTANQIHRLEGPIDRPVKSNSIIFIDHLSLIKNVPDEKK